MIVQGLGIIGGLLMPPLIARLRTMSYVAFGLGCLFFLGYALMILIDQRGTTETWTPILVVLLGTTVALAVLGLVVGRPTYIDDELADRGIGEKKPGRIQLDRI